MKSTLLNSLILAALAVPGVAMAAEASPVTANIGLTTDYIFRGITQNVGKPAIQGGIDYAHSSGLYAGVWGSNVGWITGSGATGNASMELDTYAGFKNSFSGDFTYDVGLIRYNYLGAYTPAAGGYVKADTDEVYAALGYKWISAKYSYALGKFLTVPSASGTNYLEINASYPIADTGITVSGHYGKQTYKGTFASTLAATVTAGVGQTATYSDYKLGVSKDFSGYVVGLAYSKANAAEGGYYTFAGKNWGKAATVLSVTHSF